MDDVALDPERATEVVSANTKGKAAEKRLYTIKELVVHFGATEWFWRSQIWSGELPYVQVGRKMLIDLMDIENFISKHKTCNLT